MPLTDRKRTNINPTHPYQPVLSLVLVGVLTACGEAGVTGDASSQTNPQANAANTSVPQVSPFSVTPSLSAAQLASDSTATVQTALTEASDTISGTPIDPPAAANPASVNVPTQAAATEVEETGTASTTTDTSNTEEASAEVATETTVDPAAVEQQGAENAVDTPDQIASETEPEPETETGADEEAASTVESETDTNTADSTPTAPTDSPSEPEEINVDASDTPENTEAQTSFSSVTTPGFNGEVLNDAIRITWPQQETARGYNVYRQADYYTTVFTNEFTDTDVFDDSYYYEIQAFDHDDNFEYIATGLTVSASTFGRTDPDAPQPNNNILDNYELVFSDEFTGMELDTSKWNTSFLWGPDLIINGEEQYYVDIKNDPDFGFNPFTFDGEYMTINTIETPAELVSKANNQAYLSGIITSYDAMKFTYGYFETRAKFTHGRGYWPAFWLLNAYYGGADPEIDIMEFIGHNQDVMYHTYHYFDSNGELRSTKSFPVTGIDFTADFHTFGVEWKPGTIIFYVDNYETLRISDANVSQEEMYILMNTAVGGWWAGSPDATTPFPGKYVIDYVRAYQSTVQYDEIQFDQPDDLIPLFSDIPGQTSPNHKPPFWLWPEGYPGKQ